MKKYSALKGCISFVCPERIPNVLLALYQWNVQGIFGVHIMVDNKTILFLVAEFDDDDDDNDHQADYEAASVVAILAAST